MGSCCVEVGAPWIFYQRILNWDFKVPRGETTWNNILTRTVTAVAAESWVWGQRVPGPPPAAPQPSQPQLQPAWTWCNFGRTCWFSMIFYDGLTPHIISRGQRSHKSRCTKRQQDSRVLTCANIILNCKIRAKSKAIQSWSATWLTGNWALQIPSSETFWGRHLLPF